MYKKTNCNDKSKNENKKNSYFNYLDNVDYSLYTILKNIVGWINNHNVFYRGELQDYKKTRLVPKIFRDKRYKINEKNYIITSLTRYPDQFANMKNLEVLSKMQHYGFPTRLLDITYNPLVALYFACYGANDCDGYVYVFFPEEVLSFDSDRATMLSSLSRLSREQYDAVDKYVKKKISSEVFFTPIEYKSTSKSILYQSYVYEISKERIAFLHKHRMIPLDLYSSFYVMPKLSNDRIKAQQGLFLICGLDDDFIYDNKLFMKIKVKKELKEEFINILDSLNINQTTLFPELISGAEYFTNKLQ